MLIISANRYTMVLESRVMLNSLEVVIVGFGVFFWGLGGFLGGVCLFFFFCAFFKNRQPKRSLHASLFFFSFAFSRIVLYSFHSSIDLGGKAAQRENDKWAAFVPSLLSFVSRVSE